MSWLSPVTRFTFTPDPSSSSYRVTVGPTVMPESLATTPNSASVASSTLPPSSTKRRSISCFVPRLSTLAGGSFHEPGRYPGPRSIATCPPASTVVRAGGSAWTTSSGGPGSGSSSSKGSTSSSSNSSADSTPTRGSGSLSAASPASVPPNWNSSLKAAATQRAPAAIASKTRRIGTPGASRSPSSPTPMRMTPVPTTPATAASVAQPVRRIDRRAPTGEVEEPDDGKHHEHDPQTDAQRRRRPRLVVLVRGLFVEVVGAETLGPVSGEEQHREAEARQREHDPAPAEHGGAAVGEEAPDRSSQVRGEPEHGQHADDDERHRERIGAVAPQLASGCFAAALPGGRARRSSPARVATALGGGLPTARARGRSHSASTVTPASPDSPGYPATPGGGDEAGGVGLQRGEIAPVDRVHLAGDPLGGIAAQQDGQRRGIGHTADAAGGVRLGEALLEPGLTFDGLLEEAVLHGPERQAIDGHAVLADLGRQAAREAHGGGLGRAVHDLLALAASAGVRDDREDPPP